MPYFYKIKPAVKVVFIRHIGRVSLADLGDQIGEITQQEEFQKGMHLLFDHREEVPPDFSSRGVVQPRQEDTFNQAKLKVLFEFFENTKMACIVKKDMAKYFASLADLMQDMEKIDNAIFFTVKEAKDWLNIPPKFDVDKILSQVIFVRNSDKDYRP